MTSTPLTVEIRQACSSQFEAIGDLICRTYQAIPGLVKRPEYERFIRDVQGRAKDTIVLAALRDEEVAGSVTYVPGPGPLAEFEDGDAAGLRLLSVDRSIQGHGICRLLVRSCIQLARKDKRSKIILHCSAPMVAAIRLYKSMGFIRTQQRDWTTADKVDLLGFELPLDMP